jgi:hypothetical protein
MFFRKQRYGKFQSIYELATHFKGKNPQVCKTYGGVIVNGEFFETKLSSLEVRLCIQCLSNLKYSAQLNGTRVEYKQGVFTVYYESSKVLGG